MAEKKKKDTYGNPIGGKRKEAPEATKGATESFGASEAGRKASIQASENLIKLGEEGVATAEGLGAASLAKIRSEAARAMASQFQTAGRRAAGGGTLASLGQSARETATAITSQDEQNKARIHAAKVSAAETLRDESQNLADLQDVTGAAQERFGVVFDSAPNNDIAAVRHYDRALETEADPEVRRLLQQERDLRQSQIGMFDKVGEFFD